MNVRREETFLSDCYFLVFLVYGNYVQLLSERENRKLEQMPLKSEKVERKVGKELCFSHIKVKPFF